MYAVIELNGSQVKVEKNDIFHVNHLECEDKKSVKVDKVLFGKKGSAHFVGDPYVKDAYVECEKIRDKRLKKVIAFKYRDRKSSQSKIGHRQDVTEFKVKDIHFAAGAEKKAEKADLT
jgi:large subunit ribosomal protein L21